MTQHTARSVHSHSGEHPFSWTAFKTMSMTPLHYFISLSISYWILLFAGRESIDFDAPVWTARFTSLSLWLAVWWFYISSTPPPHSDLGRGLISEHEWKQLCRAALKKPLLNSSEGYKEAQPRIQYTHTHRKCMWCHNYTNGDNQGVFSTYRDICIYAAHFRLFTDCHWRRMAEVMKGSVLMAFKWSHKQ